MTFINGIYSKYSNIMPSWNLSFGNDSTVTKFCFNIFDNQNTFPATLQEFDLSKFSDLSQSYNIPKFNIFNYLNNFPSFQFTNNFTTNNIFTTNVFSFNTNSLQFPEFSLNWPITTNASVNSSTPVRKSSSTSMPSNSNISHVSMSFWKAQGYNEKKGKLLAANTKKRSDELHNNGIKAQCGMGVRGGINDTFYAGTGVHVEFYYEKGKKKAKYVGKQHYTKFGAACNTGKDFLYNDKNFKKVDVSHLNLSPKDIPAGAIVIYAPGYSNGAGKTLGHIEVSYGNGLGYSDVTTHLLSNWGRQRKPQEIWIPV